MIYFLVIAASFAGLVAETARTRTPEAAPIVALIIFAGVFLSLAIPPLIYKYSNDNPADVVLTRLIYRAALGSGLFLFTILLAWWIAGRAVDPALIGEYYIFSLLGLFLFQGFGGVITNHVMYLQQTKQYNSNQLVAVLITLTLLLFVLVLYFLAFDLARPPESHPYTRDMIAITLILLGYGRGVYLMAHH